MKLRLQKFAHMIFHKSLISHSILILEYNYVDKYVAEVLCVKMSELKEHEIFINHSYISTEKYIDLWALMRFGWCLMFWTYWISLIIVQNIKENNQPINLFKQTLQFKIPNCEKKRRKTWREMTFSYLKFISLFSLMRYLRNRRTQLLAAQSAWPRFPIRLASATLGHFDRIGFYG